MNTKVSDSIREWVREIAQQWLRDSWIERVFALIVVVPALTAVAALASIALPLLAIAVPVTWIAKKLA